MKTGAEFVSSLVGARWSAGLTLVFTLCLAVHAHSQDVALSRLQADENPKVSKTVTAHATAGPQELRHPEVTHRLTGFYEDRSLDVAIAVEKVCATYLRYRVRLQLPSGKEQSIAVTAPPGGLQPEVRDMTGDDIRNDLVLTPALFPWPSTVLVNDGHDHFAVANSGAPPGSLSPGGNVSWSAGNAQMAVALTSSGFRTGGIANREGVFIPQLKKTFFISISQTAASRFDHAPSLGRGPPALIGLSRHTS